MNQFKPHACLHSSKEIKNWYESNYHLLSLAGLWLKGGEPNTMPPHLFSQADLRFLICRLSTYRDVTASISHSLVSQIAREIEGVFVDFAFLAPPKDMRLMVESKIPLWVGTTTKEPPRAFDVLGISNSFVLELLNLPSLLLHSDIPLFKTERMLCDDIPLIVLGGANSAVTSILHGPVKGQGFGDNYGLVDAVILGEGEYAVKQFLEIVKKGKSSGSSKTEILEECHGKVDGFYEPDKYVHQYKTVVNISQDAHETNGKANSEQKQKQPETLVEILPVNSNVSYPVKRAIVHDLNNVRTLESGPIWYETEHLGVGSMQISNGCPCFCSFCAESWEKKPYRERSLTKLSEGLIAAKAQQGLDTINLASFNFNTHSELYTLILSLYKDIANISLKSQRFDLLSTDRFLVEVQQAIGKTTVSCGMEGISERLRRHLHKNLTEEQIYQACEYLFTKGLRELKIFLINTGLEDANDFQEFSNFVESLEKLKSMSDCKVRIIFSIASLYYPPHTPLQFHECLTSLEQKKNTVKELERTCKRNGMEFRESASHEETWLMQLLAGGDRRLTAALIRSAITDDFFYYNKVQKRVVSNWRSHLTELGVSEKDYFCAKDENYVFPWDDIDMGVPRKFLWDEYKRSVSFTERDYCLGRPNIKAQCLGCGACPSADHIQRLTQHEITQPFLMEELQQIAKNKRNVLKLRIVVNIEPEMHLLSKQFFGVAIARALMLAIPEIIPYYQFVLGHVRNFTGEKSASDFTHGINIYYLKFLSNDKVKKLLNTESISEKITDIQKHCEGFKIVEGSLESDGEMDMQYILYRFNFTGEFTASFIERALGKHLHENYVKHTLYKKEGNTIFKVDAKSKKNAVVTYAKINKATPVNNAEEDFSLFMAVTKRFDCKTFLDECYGFDRRRETVRVKIEALGYYGKEASPGNSEKCISCSGRINETFLAGYPLGHRQCLACSIETKKSQ